MLVVMSAMMVCDVHCLPTQVTCSAEVISSERYMIDKSGTDLSIYFSIKAVMMLLLSVRRGEKWV